MKTPEENEKYARLLSREADRSSTAYATHLMYGGKGDPSEEEWIEALDEGAKAILFVEELESRLAQVERERDAAVHDLKLADRVDCDFCKHQYGGCTYDGCQDCSKPCPCGSCRNSSNYEWRGVCEANTEEETK